MLIALTASYNWALLCQVIGTPVRGVFHPNPVTATNLELLEISISVTQSIPMPSQAFLPVTFSAYRSVRHRQVALFHLAVHLGSVQVQLDSQTISLNRLMTTTVPELLETLR